MMSDLVLKPIQGKRKLWIVFWLHYLPGILLINFVFSFLDMSPNLHGKLYVLALIVFWLYMGVSLWKCAFNGSHKWLGYIARIFVFVNVATLPYAIYILFYGKFTLASHAS